MKEEDFWKEFEPIIKRMRDKKMTRYDYFELNKFIIAYKYNVPFWY